ncbi:hypothetical protein VPH35_095943 [Triticum aestivum]
MDITMSRVCSASDTCDTYFTYTKVNHFLYTCSLDTFEDGILLDNPLVCMHRYCRNTKDDEEECKRQGTTTSSTREAWKRRRKKTELLKLQRPDIRARGRTSGASAAANSCTNRRPKHQRPDIRPMDPDIRRDATARTSGFPPEIRHQQQEPTEGHPARAGHPANRPGHPASHESPDIRPPARTSDTCLRAESGQRTMYPFPTYPFVA